MKRSDLKVRIPNPHQRDVSAALLKEILHQAGISEAAWERS